eukprot:scaffold88907_cov17-Tisochrysis_lutea.AAC.1
MPAALWNKADYCQHLHWQQQICARTHTHTSIRTYAQELQAALHGLRVVLNLQACADGLVSATRKASACIADCRSTALQSGVGAGAGGGGYAAAANPQIRSAAPPTSRSSAAGIGTTGINAMGGVEGARAGASHRGKMQEMEANMCAAISAAAEAGRQLHAAAAQLRALLGAGAHAEKVLLARRIEEVCVGKVGLGKVPLLLILVADLWPRQGGGSAAQQYTLTHAHSHTHNDCTHAKGTIHVNNMLPLLSSPLPSLQGRARAVAGLAYLPTTLSSLPTPYQASMSPLANPTVTPAGALTSAGSTEGHPGGATFPSCTPWEVCAAAVPATLHQAHSGGARACQGQLPAAGAVGAVLRGIIDALEGDGGSAGGDGGSAVVPGTHDG